MSRPDATAAVHPPAGPPAADKAGSGICFGRVDFLWAATLALMAILPVVPFLLRHETILGTVGAVSSENLNEWEIYRRFLNNCLGSGLFPAWTPQLMAGMPFIGWPHTSAFAPLGVIYYLLPYNTAAVVGLFVHALIFTVSMYVLLRFLSFRPFAAWCAAVMALNYFAVSQSDHYLPRLFSFSWSPLLAAFYVGIWRTRRFRHLIGAAAVLAIQVLGGNIEIIARQFLALGTVGLALGLLAPGDLWARRREIFLIGASVALGTFPSLCQSLPALEFVHYSVRSGPEGFTYGLYAASTSMSPLYILSTGRIVLSAVMASALILCVLELRRSLLVRVLALSALANLVIAANGFGVLKILYHVPVLGRMMWHLLSVHFVAIIALVLAGKALDHALGRSRPRHLIILVLSLLAVGGLSLGEAAVGNISLYSYPLDRVVAAAARLAPVLMALAVPGFVAWRLKGRGLALAAGVLAAAVLIGSYVPLFIVLHREPDSFPNWDPAYVDFFATRSGPYRSLNIVPNDLWNRPAIPYQVGFVPGTEAIDAFVSSPLSWYGGFYMLLLRNVRPQAYGPGALTTLWAEKGESFISPKNLHLLDLLNLSYIATNGININLASHYFLGYSFTPASCTGRPCRALAPEEKYGHPGIALSGPSQWKEKVFAQPGSELRLTLRAGTAGAESAPIFFQAVAAPAEKGGRRLIYARALDAASAPPRPVVRIVLAAEQGMSMELLLRAVPLDTSPAAASALELVDPFIFNPDAPFQRLALQGVNIFQNRSALPRCFVTHGARVIAEKSKRLAYIGGDAFDPSAEVVLDEGPALEASATAGRAGEPVRILLYRPGKIVLYTELAAPGYLVISDTYCPGWTAEAGEVPQRILRADHAFQALYLDRGPHQVTLTYWPASLRIGLFAALAGICVLALPALIRYFLLRPGLARPG